MLRKSILVAFCALVLGPAWSALAAYDPALAVYWPLDEGTGTVANDATGNGITGTISAGPTWAAVGKIGGAINFTGTGDIRGAHVAIDSRSFTIAMWVNPRLPASGSGIVFSEQSSGANSVSLHLRIGGPASTDSPVSGIRFGFYNDDVDSPANVLQSNNWYHLTFRYDSTSKNQRIYVNGVQVAMRTATNHFLATSGVICLGSWTGGSNYTGMVDDFQLYQKALSDKEIQSIMAGLSNKNLAVNVSPEDGATDVTRDATLNWTAGQYPATHDVYLGTTAADVNNASRTNKGLLVSQGQADTSFDPAGVFAYGQTYYWRVDEVNTSADGTIYKGGVWSFTAEPYGYPITKITATASSAAASMGPEKTIDGSGLTADLHGTEGTTMWLTGGAKPNWIQYQFDKVY
ncbi:MAG: LamG domain-containing protein [Phycisphaerae bacterium]|nr:LamG domain-containing protein [Phycisphaerae bacterium]